MDRKINRTGGLFLRGAAVLCALALSMLGASSEVLADEPIVGLWQTTLSDAGGITDRVFEAFHSDNTEIENDTSPILAENVCPGTWVSLGDHTYGLTHPFFNFYGGQPGTTELNEGQPDGTSGLLLFKVTVDKNRDSFGGKWIFETCPTQDPFDSSHPCSLTDSGTLTAKRVTVDKSMLPQ